MLDVPELVFAGIDTGPCRAETVDADREDLTRLRSIQHKAGTGIADSAVRVGDIRHQLAGTVGSLRACRLVVDLLHVVDDKLIEGRAGSCGFGADNDGDRL